MNKPKTPINTHYLQLMVVADYGKPGPPGADVGDGGVQGCAQRHAQLALEFTWTLILHHIQNFIMKQFRSSDQLSVCLNVCLIC